MAATRASPGGRAARPWLPALLLPLTAAALLLRAWAPATLGLDHFDEGVYAISARGLLDGVLYPDQILFSPPLYFGLVGLLHSAAGLPVDAAAHALSILLGTATVVAVFLVGRAWFGAGAGLAAAVLVALSEFQIGLSRSGLTDTTYALLHLIAFFAVVEALRRESWRRAALAGLAVGLAWNTKYHGWLSAAVPGVAVAIWVGLHRGAGRRELIRSAAVLVVCSVVAGLVYAPWALHVDSHPGGYAALAEYQRGMLQSGWLENAWWQVQFQLFLEGPLTRASVPAAVLGAILAGGSRVAPGARRALLVLGVGASALALGGAATTVLLALLAVPLLLQRRAELPAVALLSWLLVWSALTPFYRPYARLLLPLSIATCLAAGAVLDDWVRRLRSAEPAPSAGWLAAACAAAVGLLGTRLPGQGNPWRASTGMRAAVDAMLPSIPARSTVFVLGEPAVLHYLGAVDVSAEWVKARELPGALAEMDGPGLVVTGIYTRFTGAESRLVDELGPGLELAGSFPVNPKDLRVLDDGPPSFARSYRARASNAYDLNLFRYEPGIPAR